jgi:hypothetical protein
MGVTSRMSREAHVRSLWAAGGEIPPADPIALEEDTGSAVSYWQDGVRVSAHREHADRSIVNSRIGAS